MLRPWNHICQSRLVGVSAKSVTSRIGRLFGSRYGRFVSRRQRQKATAITTATESLETRQLLAATPIAGLSDEFVDSSSIAEWQRVNEVEGWNADQLQQWDVDQTQAGRMTMTPETVVWYGSWRGPMAFKEVTGDFVFTTQVHITDRDDIGNSDSDDVPGDGQYSLGGVMIRTPRDITNPETDWTAGSMADDGTNNGENYVFLSLGYGAGGNEFSLEVKTTRNSNSQLELTALGQDASVVNVQTARIGTDVFTLYQLPGEEWQVHRRFSRPDMPETIQVGLVTYTDWEKANDFDPYYHNGHVLTGDVDPTPDQPFNPDLVAGFEYARFVRPDVPDALAGINLRTQATDAELLTFLGTASNVIEGEPVVDPPIEPPVENEDAPDMGMSDSESVLVDDQTMSHSQDILQIELPTELSGLAVTYDATVVDNIAATLNAEYSFYVFRDDFGENWGGHNERWLQGNGDDYFYILPTGELFAWSGNFETSTILASLDTSFYFDPVLLTTAEPIAVAVGVSGSTLTIDPSAQFSGEFSVELTSTVSGNSSSQTFLVNVLNSAPQIADLDNQTLLVGSDALVVDLVGSDSDGDPLTYEVRIEGSLASEMMSTHNLYEISGQNDYALNWGGQSEKWLRGDNGWYFLLPDGTLNAWDGSFESSSQLAALSVDIYDDPQILLNATVPDVSAEVIDGQLVITPGDQTGVFGIEVLVSDGFESDQSSFSLEVTNTAPELSIDDQSATSGVAREVALPVIDADGQEIFYTVEVLGDELSALDNEHGFWAEGNYFDNYLGQNERWIRDADNQWHYLLPTGELHRWDGSFDASPLIASLGSEVYDDPSLLTDPQTVPVTAIIENGLLIVTPADGYTGEVQIRVTASDGYAAVSTTFRVGVTASADDEFESVDNVYADWDSLEV